MSDPMAHVKESAVKKNVWSDQSMFVIGALGVRVAFSSDVVPSSLTLIVAAGR